MVSVEIRVTPFAVERNRYTTIIVDNDYKWLSGSNSKFFSYVIKKPMRRWMCPYRERVFVWPGFLPALMKEVNEDAYSFQFSGTKEDYAFFEREIRYQEKNLAIEELKIDVSLKENMDIARISDGMKGILNELHDNSTISKTQRQQLKYVRKQLNPSGAGIMVNEEISDAQFSMLKVWPKDSGLSDMILNPVIPVVFIFLIRDDMDMERLPDIISYLKSLGYAQSEHTYLYFYGTICTKESGWHTKLTDVLRKNHIYVKKIETFASKMQIRQYMEKDISQILFWEQNVGHAIQIIEDSISGNNASEDAIQGYRDFRNQIFVK